MANSSIKTFSFLGCLGLAVVCNTMFASFSFANNQSTSEDQRSQDEIDYDKAAEIALSASSLSGEYESSESFCLINVLNSGVLGNSIENNILSSRLNNGSPGKLQVTTSSTSYTLSIDPPLGFSSYPPETTNNISMTASISGHGATNFSESPDNHTVQLNTGTTSIVAHLDAKKLDSLPFAAGNYAAELTIRCE